MNKLVFALAFTMTATAAHANHTGVITAVHPSYFQEKVTYYREVCYNVEVPVYGNAPVSGGDVVAGAIIGGVIGNQFGGGSGKDAMTALGAIIGAETATRRNQIVGYQVQTQCTQEPYTEIQQVQDGYDVTYNVRGNFYSFHTYKKYKVGDTVIVRH